MRIYEDAYLAVGNLVKLRIARHILSDCLFMDATMSHRHGKVLQAIDKQIDWTEAEIDVQAD